MFALVRRLPVQVVSAAHRSRALAVAVALTLVLSLGGIAQATDPIIPDVGVDFSELITAAGVALGTTVTVIVALYFAFLLVKKSMQWARKAF